MFQIEKIGAKTIEKLGEYAEEKQISLMEAVRNADNIDKITKRTAEILKEFSDMIFKFVELAESESVLEIFDLILEDTKYIDSFGEDEEGRVENVNELRSSIYEMEEESEEHLTLGEYLEITSLMSATDSLEEDKDYVKLMTIHNSKGLEFPIVFLTGMEQEIFPGFSKEEDEEALEEERRLCYVAITRAEKELHLTQSLERVVYGQKSYMRPPSRFIEEIPVELIEMEGTKLERKTEKVKTSGIENFNPFKINNEVEGAYLPGDKVIHKKFGQGLIKDVEEGKRIVIRFREGEKKIPLAVADKFLSKVD